MSKLNIAKIIALNPFPKKIKNFIWSFFSCDANQRNQHGTPLLNIITQTGNLAGIEFLLKQGAYLDTSAISGYNAFHAAAFIGRTDIINFFCEKGININLMTHQGETAFMLALMNRHTPIIELLINNKTIDFKNFDENKKTTLHYAAQSGYTNVSDWLVKEGVSINSIDNKGKTPLDYAIENKHTEVIKFFIKHILLKNVNEEKPICIQQNADYSNEWDQIKDKILTKTLKKIKYSTNKSVAQRIEKKLHNNHASSLFNLSFQAISRNAIKQANEHFELEFTHANNILR